MKLFKTLITFSVLFFALGVAFLSRGPNSLKTTDKKLLPIENLNQNRVHLSRIKPLELNWNKGEGEGISMKDLRILRGDIGKLEKNSIEEESPVTKKRNSVSFRLRPSEDLYWKFQENNFDVESALKEIDLKRPPVKGEIQINF